MKKALIIVLAVAILGTLGYFIKGSDGSSTLGTANSSNVSAQPAASSTTNAGSSGSTTSSTSYKDGTYTETSETPYGNVKIGVIIKAGKINDIELISLPKDEQRSVEISSVAGPILRREAIDAQSANIDFVSGATSTSYGFQESLQAALDAAKVS